MLHHRRASRASDYRSSFSPVGQGLRRKILASGDFQHDWGYHWSVCRIRNFMDRQRKLLTSMEPGYIASGTVGGIDAVTNPQGRQEAYQDKKGHRTLKWNPAFEERLMWRTHRRAIPRNAKEPFHSFPTKVKVTVATPRRP